jgi:hypothetical protein
LQRSPAFCGLELTSRESWPDRAEQGYVYRIAGERNYRYLMIDNSLGQRGLRQLDKFDLVLMFGAAPVFDTCHRAGVASGAADRYSRDR